MRKPSRHAALAACVLAVVTAPDPLEGFIEAMYPFKQILDESSHVLVGKVEKVDVSAKRMVARIEGALKGQAEFKEIQMSIGTGIPGHPEYLLDRAKVGGDILFFYKREGNTIQCEAHTSDTWFQLYCQDNPQARAQVWWTMSHIEIKLGRTFNGGTSELIKLTGDVLGKRVEPPAPDPNVPPLDVTARRVTLSADGKGGGFHSQVQFKFAPGQNRGLTWADVNSDGLPDVHCCRQAGNILLVNQRKGFEDQTSRVGLFGASWSGCWADYNADGLPDLLTSNFQLFTNAGGRFHDTPTALPAPAQRRAESVVWIDFDGDGLPDILGANGPLGLVALRNTGGVQQKDKPPVWFADVTAQAGLGPKGPGAGDGLYLTCFDYDGDGLTDVLCTLGAGLLLHNDGGGRFVPDASSGIELPGPGNFRRGVAVADFDNDGNLDLFVPGPQRPRLYRNNNDGTFTDVLDAAGDLAGMSQPSVAAAFGDVNGDGYLDLFVCNTEGSSHLYLGDGRGRFTDISEAAGIKGLAPALSASFADIDEDGDLDLVVNLPDRVVVALNQVPLPAGRGAVLVGLGARKGQTGAVVRAFDESGRPLGRRELGAPDGLGGQTPPVAHFALPEGACVISVCLTDGRATHRVVEVGQKPVKVVFDDKDFGGPAAASAPTSTRAATRPATAPPPPASPPKKP